MESPPKFFIGFSHPSEGVAGLAIPSDQAGADIPWKNALTATESWPLWERELGWGELTGGISLLYPPGQGHPS
jgi:hypothetical protein